MQAELSSEARAVIKSYLSLPNLGVVCPYYNNSRSGMRLGMRALTGKGTAQEIVDEATLYSLREKVDLKNLADKDKSRFLVDHRLGVDCSAMAYYILDAESQSRGKGAISSHMFFPLANSALSRLRRFIANRYVENAGTRTFAHEHNSHEVKPRDVAPGDFFVRINPTGRNHIMIVTTVNDSVISIAQSEARDEEGRYDHGVRVETVTRDHLPDLPLRRLNWLAPSEVEGL